jgi:NAD(P)H-dependent flavin oxidoreductase YrpB (nitropropane dioxygenase family)
MLAAAGVHGVVAQGYEAGGHRGVFDPDADDDRLGTMVLTRLIAREVDLPVIAAGGIMDGAGVSAALRLGASAAQLGTAFIACPESQADAGYRAALASDAANHTVMTRAISGVRRAVSPTASTRSALAFPPTDSRNYPTLTTREGPQRRRQGARRLPAPNGRVRERPWRALCQRPTLSQRLPPKQGRLIDRIGRSASPASPSLADRRTARHSQRVPAVARRPGNEKRRVSALSASRRINDDTPLLVNGWRSPRRRPSRLRAAA